jgi:hypothetical protein
VSDRGRAKGRERRLDEVHFKVKVCIGPVQTVKGPEPRSLRGPRPYERKPAGRAWRTE